MPDPVAAAAQFSGFPAWVLLEPFASFGECRNHTTATSLTSFKRPIEVSFDLVDPPRASRWFVRLVGRKNKKRGFYGRPTILNSSGSFVVILMAFYRDDGSIFDHFVYKAGPGTPSLDLIPEPCPTVDFPKLIGILPSDDGGHYSVIFPVPEFWHNPMYEILVFSSADQSWSTKFGSICPDSGTTYNQAVVHHPSKAIAVGRGSLAWIDLWRGVLLCDGLDEDNPVLRLIKWPVPLPCSNAMDLHPASASRAATLSDGTIRFVKMKFHYSGCCHSRDTIGWTATMWKRRCSSSEECEWEMCYELDIAKILRGCSLKLPKGHSSSSDLHLLRKVWDTKSNRLDLNKVLCAFPILSLTNEDIVYFMMNLFSKEALLIAVNVRKKKLEAVEQTPFEVLCSPCSFSSRLLDASSGTDDTAANQSDECDDIGDNVDCVVTILQAALDELKDIGEHLQVRKPWYTGITPLCADDGSSSSSLHDVIEAVAPCFSENLHNNSTTDVADLLTECFRELEDIKSRILAPVEEMKNKVSLALAALDTLQNGHMSIHGKGGDAEMVSFLASIEPE